jgi:hypothetical protein
MRTILLVVLGLCGILALTARVGGGPGDEAADPTEGATYIGEASCKKCHMKEHRTWKKMKHAGAWENLPEKYRNMDAKDEGGQQCVSCHVTGWGHADRGGFKDIETSKELLGVQCEACHGPGSKHREAGQKVLDEKRTEFNADEKRFIVNKTTNCSDCHNPHVTHEQYKEGQ